MRFLSFGTYRSHFIILDEDAAGDCPPEETLHARHPAAFNFLMEVTKCHGSKAPVVSATEVAQASGDGKMAMGDR